MTTFRICILLVMWSVASSLRIGDEEVVSDSARRLQQSQVAQEAQRARARSAVAAAVAGEVTDAALASAAFHETRHEQSAETKRGHCYIPNCSGSVGWWKYGACRAKCALKSSCGWRRNRGCA
eukprot:TRINITY_DN33631_c0_g1_i1.p1 TRINITY_DN33631_c0_g1~~TRINITY_DN33631_c0_g1_i1.p1  ORF type:complete len:138 (-),score=12.65 TRINITY_DN33631_c0_g1_i1:184-552(-)